MNILPTETYNNFISIKDCLTIRVKSVNVLNKWKWKELISLNISTATLNNIWGFLLIFHLRTINLKIHLFRWLCKMFDVSEKHLKCKIVFVDGYYSWQNMPRMPTKVIFEICEFQKWWKNVPRKQRVFVNKFLQFYTLNIYFIP